MHYDWLDILDEANINPYNWNYVSPQIHRKSFHSLRLQPKNYIPIYTIKERNRKLGFRENIWPFRNGIGRCVLIEGDMSIINNYQYGGTPDIKCDESGNSSTVSLMRSRTEREFLHLAYNSGIFNKLLESNNLYLGTSGKLYVCSNAKYYETINFETVQFELDWCIETKDTIALFEAKFPAKGCTNDFVLFQAFYPILYTSLIEQKKKIRFFFLDILKSTDSVDYHFIEIKFDSPNDLSSYVNTPIGTKTIRLNGSISCET